MTALLARPLQAARTRPRLWPATTAGQAGLVLTVLASVCGLVGGRLVDSSRVDGFGILNAMPPVYWVGVLCGVVATGLLLRAVVDGERLLGPLIPGVWLVLLHLAPELAHDHARFSIVYIHMGFIRLIDATRTGDVIVDARFAWPGFFGMFMPSLPAMSEGAFELVMRLWPAMITGAATGLVAALARRSYPTQPAIAPLSALVFVVLSWTGQDYFSPQSVGFLLYLSMVIVVECGPLRARGSWSSVAPVLSRFATAGGDRPEARSAPTFVALIIMAFGAIVSHPLAPFFMCAGLAMLGLYGRRVAWRLMVIVGLSYVIWFALAAKPFWIGQFGPMLKEFGHTTNVGTAGTERGAVGTPAHSFVLTVRAVLGLSVFLFTLIVGSAMATNRFKHLRPTLPLAPLAGIPVVAAAVQSYGGEMIIRVFLFTLPMASILFARVLLSIPRRAVQWAVPMAVLSMVPVFLLARFGNEAFEMVTNTDYDAVQALYEGVTDRTVLVTDNSFQPWGDRYRETLTFRYSQLKATPDWLASLRSESQLEVHVGDYRKFRQLGSSSTKPDKIRVLITPSQGTWLHEVQGEPDGGLETVAQWLSIQPGVTTLYHEGGGWVFEVEP